MSTRTRVQAPNKVPEQQRTQASSGKSRAAFGNQQAAAPLNMQAPPSAGLEHVNVSASSSSPSIQRQVDSVAGPQAIPISTAPARGASEDGQLPSRLERFDAAFGRPTARQDTPQLQSRGQRPIVQAKLRVGSASDVYEAEADRVARQVMSMFSSGRGEPSRPAAASVQRQVGSQSGLQRDARPGTQNGAAGTFDADKGFEEGLSKSKGQGMRLSDTIRSEFEPKFGSDFSQIHVHTGGEAAALNNSISSKAFTHGNHIYFNSGQYSPETSAGKELLAHELTHTIQQGAAPVQRQIQRRPLEESSEETTEHPAAEVPSIEVRQSPANVVQRKHEYANLHRKDRNLAREIVALHPRGYQGDQNLFEAGLGQGLYVDKRAMEGADALLKKMKEAIEAAGLDDVTVKKAFGRDPDDEDDDPTLDMGAILLDDVEEALADGNLREKMGMVYRAISSGQFALVLAKLRQQADWKKKLGKELLSNEMTEALNKANIPSYAIFNRRDSVQNPKVYKRAIKNNNEIAQEDLLNANELSSKGLELSKREAKAAKPDQSGQLQWLSGRDLYKLDQSGVQASQKDLIRLASGMSGSTDMYFHAANHLKLGPDQKRKLRLAALGQMLSSEDHSYHEIMHMAKTQGGLDDYADELPLGYTTLAPLNPDQILNTAKCQEFPGDRMIREFVDGRYDQSPSVPALKKRLRDLNAMFLPLQNNKNLDAEYRKDVLSENLGKIRTMKDYLTWKKSGVGGDYQGQQALENAWTTGTLGDIRGQTGAQHEEDFDLDTNWIEGDQLTELEKRAIYGWTDNMLYARLRQAHYDEIDKVNSEESEEVVHASQALKSGLAKLPSFEGTVYSGVDNEELITQAVERVENVLKTRGENAARDQARKEHLPLFKHLPKGREVEGFESFSKRARSSYIWKKGKPVAQELRTKANGRAKDISMFSRNMEEREVLLTPNTKMERIAVSERIVDYLKAGKIGGAVTITFREV